MLFSGAHYYLDLVQSHLNRLLLVPALTGSLATEDSGVSSDRTHTGWDGANDAAGFTSCCGPAGCAPPRGGCRSTSAPASRPMPAALNLSPELHRTPFSSEASNCWTYARIHR
jgi:hypothetical protein